MKNLKSQKITVRFSCTKNIHINAWTGAVVRNHFLFATSRIGTGNGKNLLQKIRECPLERTHPLYKSMAAGFPPPFVADCRNMLDNQYPTQFHLTAGKEYSLPIVVFGNHTELLPQYAEAVQFFAQRGIGPSRIRLQISDISTEQEVFTDISIPAPQSSPTPKRTKISLCLQTPVCLFHPTRKRHTANTFQDRMNGFPSFYQIVRSLLYRHVTLKALHDNGQETSIDQINQFVENRAILAAEAELTEAGIHYVEINSTRKPHQSTPYKMQGYTGELTFCNVPLDLLPLLDWGQTAGVGNDISYGLGLYAIQTPKANQRTT